MSNSTQSLLMRQGQVFLCDLWHRFSIVSNKSWCFSVVSGQSSGHGRHFMGTTLPEKSTNYLGPITDTSRWNNFRYRPDDFFICTPPKCGTTWTQAISAMLVFGAHDHGHQSSVLSPWIDASFAPVDEYLAQIELQSNRRFIKTHTACWHSSSLRV